MCFSAPASFAAGATLGVLGVVTISKARTTKEIPLASIPLLLGLQQATEGIVWISFGAPLLNSAATFIYSLFAYVLWPIYVPLAIFLIEPDPVRKSALRLCAFIGGFLSLYLLYFGVTEPVSSEIVGQSIAYHSATLYPIASILIYLVAVCGSCFLSSHRMIQILGLTLFIAFGISYWFYTQTFFSVWCFFAALLSVTIYFHLAHTRTTSVSQVTL
ncbi:hypothetical protein HY968_04935 [Candidatus Kaiserbacteria bacterium]|nr:hypothetical protein [Candidatus Kaiserbacteria bacterium]